jgi:hypothetical protein
MDSMFYVGIAIAIGITVGLVMSLVYKSALKGQKALIWTRTRPLKSHKKLAYWKEATLEAKLFTRPERCRERTQGTP